MPARRKIVMFLIGVAVVAAAFLVANGLVRSRPQPKKTEATDLATPVEVLEARPGPHVASMQAQGTVVAAQQVTLQTQVGGRVVWQSDELVPGGRFKSGAPLLRIDGRDYHATVRQQQAQVSNQQLALEQEQGRRVVAEREWALFGDKDRPDAGATDAGRSLALREPHLDSARASLEAAQSSLTQAQINLSRTTLTAPFNGFVVSESVDVGQVVAPGASLGTLVGSDAFWIRISLPVDNLASIRLPGPDGTGGAAASVWQDVGGSRVTRSGRLIRLLGDLDPVGRMARLIVEVEDPLGIKQARAAGAGADAGAGGSLPLLLGAYVHVELQGGELDNVIEIPRGALHDDARVYVVGEGDRLAIREVTIAWRKESSVLVSRGLSAGDRIVTSPVGSPIEGMPLRVTSLGGGRKAPAAPAQDGGAP